MAENKTNDKLVFLKKGKDKENQFSKLFSTAIETSQNEDMNEHVDVFVNVGVDVKGLKKINRNDQNTNEHIHWIEIRGVKDAGWLYGGKADFFAFETIDYWVVVEKEDLKDLIKKKTKKEKVDKPEDALYKLYGRKNRNDLLTMVKTIDLMSISTVIINKI